MPCPPKAERAGSAAACTGDNAAWREHTGKAREQACLDAQAAYDAAIAAYDATTEAAWNEFDARRAT